MNRWCRARRFGVLLSASVLLAGCSSGGDDDIPSDNKEDVAALKNLGAKFEVNRSGHIRRVEFPRSAVESADLLSPDGPIPQGDVGNDDLAHLEGLPGLSVLVLYGTRIGDEGLAHLAKLKNLETLDLMQTRVTDEGLKHLSGLERLKSLDLTGTRVTDDCVETLVKLARLESLYLSKTLVTEKGREKLTLALPDIRISYNR